MQNPVSEQKNEENLCSNPVVLSSDDDEPEETLNNNKQIVLYDPSVNGVPQPDPIQIKEPGSQKILPSVGAFTVQCAVCFKWRLIPTKEKYEEIREHILEQPFSCDLAKEWRPEISCDVEGDIEQDNSRLWAIDTPNIAQPPPGWERELRIRGEGSSKFADVYYIAPSGKRLRSMVEVQKFLFQHPEYMAQGVTLSQFSFRIPKPLQENYVRKRTARLPGDAAFGRQGSLPTIKASPLSWIVPTEPTTLHGRPDVTPPAKKKARPSKEHPHSSSPFQLNPQNLKIHGVYEF
ncbi:unnamed protein product [Amaranthus hypochondriacus]